MALCQDVLPFAKPQAESFQQVMDAVGASPETSVMFEDSMKNVKACHALGIRTVLLKDPKVQS